MARIRSIKPEFFQHEALYDAERESGLPPGLDWEEAGVTAKGARR